MYRPVHTKPARGAELEISEFQEMSNRQTPLIDAIFEMGNGLGRRRATEFFVGLRRGGPETYNVDFIVEARVALVGGVGSRDYVESMPSSTSGGTISRGKIDEACVGGCGVIPCIYEIR